MLVSLAIVADLENRLGVPEGSLEGADLARAKAALDDASALVRAEAGRDWIDDEGNAVAPAAVVTVVLRASAREYQNPRGFSSELLGEYQYQTRQTSGVYLTDDERRIVKVSSGWAGTGSIRTPSPYGLSAADVVDPWFGA
jgi:hypothetical protein